MVGYPVYNPPVREHQLYSLTGTVSVPAPEYHEAMKLVNALAGLYPDPKQNRLFAAINVLQALELSPDLVYLARLYWRHPTVQDYVTLTCLHPYVEGPEGYEKQYEKQLEDRLNEITIPPRALKTVERIVETLNVNSFLTNQSAAKYSEIIISSVIALEAIFNEKGIPIGSLHEADDQILELDLPTILKACLQHE